MIRHSAGGRIVTPAGIPKLRQNPYCCLHLGMPKTGTTCLQRHLFPRHTEIAYLGKFEGTGKWFPNAGAEALNAYLSGKVLPGVNRCRRLISELIGPALIAGRTPLWSREGLTAGGAARKQRNARAFRAVFGECKVILFVREPLKFIESMYFQNLKGFQKPNRTRPAWAHHFGTLPRYFGIEPWLDVMWALPQKGAIGHLLCAETAEIYADVFGRERVRVFVFEQFAEDPDATVRQLCRFMGVDSEEGVELLQGKRENDRWTVAQIERLKRIEESRWRSIVFRRGRLKTRQRMLGLDVARESTSAPKARAEIPAHWQQRILDFARGENRRLVERWDLPLDRYRYPL